MLTCKSVDCPEHLFFLDFLLVSTGMSESYVEHYSCNICNITRATFALAFLFTYFYRLCVHMKEACQLVLQTLGANGEIKEC